MSKKKITDIFQEKVVTRKERNEYGEWETVEKTFHKKRPVDGLSLLLRVVNFFVDIIVVSIIQVPIGLIAMSKSSRIFDLLPILTYLTYCVLFEFYFQKTVGKYLTGSLVVNEYGERPDLKTICLRTISRLVPFDTHSILWTQDNRFWHDIWSKTYVISKTELSLINRIQLGEKPKKSDEGSWDKWHNWQQ